MQPSLRRSGSGRRLRGCLSEQRRGAAGRVPILPESVRVRARWAQGRISSLRCPRPTPAPRRSNSPRRGVHLLAALGCDTLAFGAETPDAAALLDAAQLLLSGEINALIRKKLATGMTYAAARADAAETLRPGMGNCCARRTTFWVSNTARQSWRRALR